MISFPHNKFSFDLLIKNKKSQIIKKKDKKKNKLVFDYSIKCRLKNNLANLNSISFGSCKTFNLHPHNKNFYLNKNFPNFHSGANKIQFNESLRIV